MNNIQKMDFEVKPNFESNASNVNRSRNPFCVGIGFGLVLGVLLVSVLVRTDMTGSAQHTRIIFEERRVVFPESTFYTPNTGNTNTKP